MSALVARHERSLMRVARHWSLCRDDTPDAYQRTLEIYARRLDSLDPRWPPPRATATTWSAVVAGAPHQWQVTPGASTRARSARHSASWARVDGEHDATPRGS